MGLAILFARVAKRLLYYRLGDKERVHSGGTVTAERSVADFFNDTTSVLL